MASETKQVKPQVKMEVFKINGSLPDRYRIRFMFPVGVTENELVGLQKTAKSTIEGIKAFQHTEFSEGEIQFEAFLKSHHSQEGEWEEVKQGVIEFKSNGYPEIHEIRGFSELRQKKLELPDLSLLLPERFSQPAPAPEGHHQKFPNFEDTFGPTGSTYTGGLSAPASKTSNNYEFGPQTSSLSRSNTNTPARTALKAMLALLTSVGIVAPILGGIYALIKYVPGHWVIPALLGGLVAEALIAEGCVYLHHLINKCLFPEAKSANDGHGYDGHGGGSVLSGSSFTQADIYLEQEAALYDAVELGLKMGNTAYNSEGIMPP